MAKPISQPICESDNPSYGTIAWREPKPQSGTLRNLLKGIIVENPVCVLCDEDDVRCLEQHHIAGKANDDAEAIVCRNCHRKLSDDQRDHLRTPEQ